MSQDYKDVFDLAIQDKGKRIVVGVKQGVDANTPSPVIINENMLAQTIMLGERTIPTQSVRNAALEINTMLLKNLDERQLGGVDASTFIENTLFRKDDDDKIGFTQAGADFVRDVLNTMIEKKLRFSPALKDLIADKGVDVEPAKIMDGNAKPMTIISVNDDNPRRLNISFNSNGTQMNSTTHKIHEKIHEKNAKETFSLFGWEHNPHIMQHPIPFSKEDLNISDIAERRSSKAETQIILNDLPTSLGASGEYIKKMIVKSVELLVAREYSLLKIEGALDKFIQSIPSIGTNEETRDTLKTQAEALQRTIESRYRKPFSLPFIQKDIHALVETLDVANIKNPNVIIFKHSIENALARRSTDGLPPDDSLLIKAQAYVHKHFGGERSGGNSGAGIALALTPAGLKEFSSIMREPPVKEKANRSPNPVTHDDKEFSFVGEITRRDRVTIHRGVKY